MTDWPEMDATSEAWPALPLAGWSDTLATLHRWMQIVGKVALELTPFLNELWNVALHVTTRGLTSGLLPAAGGALQLDFDFVEHQFALRHSDGRTKTVPLTPMTVATFYREVMAALAALGTSISINPWTVELPRP